MTPYYDDKGITLYYGDCLAVMPELAAQSFDAIVTDVPYGTTACAWDSPIPFAPMWACLKRLVRPRAAIALFGSQPFTSALVMSNPGWFRHGWVWDKTRVTGGANAGVAPMKAHEDIVVFSQLAAHYNPQMGNWENITLTRIKPALTKKSDSFSHQDHYSPGREEKLERGRYPDSVIRIPALGSIHPERTGHPTQKPLALMEYLVKTYTNPGDRVLDFTSGSGTTLRACKNLGRQCVGIEQDCGYCEATVKRLAPAFEQALIDDGAALDDLPMFAPLEGL